MNTLHDWKYCPKMISLRITIEIQYVCYFQLNKIMNFEFTKRGQIHYTVNSNDI